MDGLYYSIRGRCLQKDREGLAVRLIHSPLRTSHGAEALGTLELVGKVHPSTELALEFEGSTLLFGFCKVWKWLNVGGTVTGSRQAQVLPILPLHVSGMWHPVASTQKMTSFASAFAKLGLPLGLP